MELQTRTMHYRCSCGSLIAVSPRSASMSPDGTLHLEVQALHEPAAPSDVPLLFPMSCRQSMQDARLAAEMQGLIAIDPKEIA